MMSKLLTKGTRAPFSRAGLIATVFAAVLAACGGGGGNSAPGATATVSPAVTPVAAPASAPVTASFANTPVPANTQAKALAASAKLADQVADPFGGVGAEAAIPQLMAFGQTVFPQWFTEPPEEPVLSWQEGVMLFKYYTKTSIYLGVVAKDSGPYKAGQVYVMGGPFGAAPMYVGMLTGFITPKAAWWAAAKIAPVGEKVFGANQLPPGCNAWAQQCWKDAVANGTVKFVATSATMTGYNDRSVVFAYVRNNTEMFGVKGLWALVPIYADDGSLVGSDISGGSASEDGWVMGTANGLILHDPVNQLCIEMYYYAVGFTWSSRPVACPA